MMQGSWGQLTKQGKAVASACVWCRKVPKDKLKGDQARKSLVSVARLGFSMTLAFVLFGVTLKGL